MLLCEMPLYYNKLHRIAEKRHSMPLSRFVGLLLRLCATAV